MEQKKYMNSDITEEMLFELKQELRDLDFSWVTLLLTQIAEDNKVEQRFKDSLSEMKIYNVFNGGIRNPSWKVLVYNQALTLKERLQKKLAKAI